MEFSPPLGGNDGLKKRWRSGEYNNLINLRTKLLNIGGQEVVPIEEIHLEKLIKHGSVINSDSLQIINGGQQHRCHQNCCYLYEENESITHIGTGWGLSNDVLWRQHSWCMKGEKIIETTVPRKIYYGILFDENNVREFIKDIAR